MADRFYRQLPAADDRFAADHRAGSLTPTASGMPCLFVPRDRLPRWAPTVYQYALHLTGQVPLPELDAAVLRRGKWLEHAGRAAIQDEFGLIPLKVDLRREEPKLPALCWLDDVVSDDTAIEYKSLSERDYAEHWEAGPPDVVMGQVHSQLCIDRNLARVIVVPIVFGFAAIRVERFEVERDPSICDMIEDTTADFVALLRRGELPEYDGSEKSYQAWQRRYPAGDEVLDLSDDTEARWRAEAWYQARLDKADVESTIEAHRWWFSRKLDVIGDNIGRVRIDSLPEDLRIKRVERKGYTVAPSSALDWRFVKRDG